MRLCTVRFFGVDGADDSDDERRADAEGLDAADADEKEDSDVDTDFAAEASPERTTRHHVYCVMCASIVEG